MFIDIDDIYCFGTGLSISMSINVAILSKTVNLHGKISEIKTKSEELSQVGRFFFLDNSALQNSLIVFTI